MKKILIPLIGTILSYSIIRFLVAGVGLGNAHNAVLGHLSLIERFFSIPAVFLYYVRTVFFPKDLAIAQTWSIEPNLLTISIPLLLTLGIFISLLTFYRYLRKEHTKQSFLFLFFFIWFFLGMLLHIQIIPLEMIVADRWFYFPFIGLLGMLGVGLSFVNKKHMTYMILISFLLLLVLSVRSFIRLGDWKDAITLYGHDSKITESYLLEHSLGYEYLQQQHILAAQKHLQKAVSIFPTSQNTNSLGVYYYQIKNRGEAEKWFQKSISLGDNFLAYNNLSRIYLSQKRYTHAEKVIETATQKFPQSENFWYLLAITEYQQGNEQEALAAAEKAYLISPTGQNTYVLQQLRLGLPIKIND